MHMCKVEENAVFLQVASHATPEFWCLSKILSHLLMVSKFIDRYCDAHIAQFTQKSAWKEELEGLFMKTHQRIDKRTQRVRLTFADNERYMLNFVFFCEVEDELSEAIQFIFTVRAPPPPKWPITMKKNINLLHGPIARAISHLKVVHAGIAQVSQQSAHAANIPTIIYHKRLDVGEQGQEPIQATGSFLIPRGDRPIPLNVESNPVSDR